MTVHTTTLPCEKRRTFEGVLQILRFNYPMFLAAALVLAASAVPLVTLPMPRFAWWAVACASAIVAFWAASTLVVSHVVYDRSPAFTFTWLTPYLPTTCRWINIHAGFDQTTSMLRRAFRHTSGTPIDLYDPAVMTERSIRRARSSLTPLAGTLCGRFDQLPLSDASTDAVLLLFAAHELRAREQRLALFGEATRTLAPSGILAVAEHLRGLPNFFAFGPGAFHFFGRKEWLLAGERAGLELIEMQALTPFATFFIWRKIK